MIITSKGALPNKKSGSKFVPHMASGGAKDRSLSEKKGKHDERERFYDRKVGFFLVKMHTARQRRLQPFDDLPLVEGVLCVVCAESMRQPPKPNATAHLLMEWQIRAKTHSATVREYSRIVS